MASKLEMGIRDFIEQTSGLDVGELDVQCGSLVRTLFDCGRLYERWMYELDERGKAEPGKLEDA